MAPAAFGGWGVLDRGEYLVNQLGWRLHGTYGDGDSFRYPIPAADPILAGCAAGQMFLVSRGTFGSLDQVLQAQMG
ncbi:MAG: hypothetical protein ACLPUG_00570 [Acidimicrobiales bacterium]